MRQIHKLLISIILISMLTLAATVVTAKEINETNLTTNEINLIKKLIKEELTKDRNPINITEAMKKAKVPSKLIPSSIQSNSNISNSLNISNILSNYGLIAYTNPISSISVQGTKFSNTIYTESYTNWASWSFYIPENSYTYVDISGNINDFDWYTSYILNLDNQYSTWAYNDGTCGAQGVGVCYQEIQRSGLFYLNKGWHTVNLNGYALFYSEYGGNSYSVNGFISILAFPEYTAIKVNSPNGGENWIKGTTKTITWTSYGRPASNVKIELFKGGILSTVIGSKTPNDGSYSWYIPSYQPIGTDYKVKITSYEESKYLDWSDNNFRIS